MKLFLCALIFPVLLFGSVSETAAQATTTASATGTVNNKNQPETQKNPALADVSKTDFKNFTYPIPNIGNLERIFTLKNGSSVKRDGLPAFTLRKTYFFDVTGDSQDEAITHIIADGCQMGCESSSLFYIHTPDKEQPKLLWKIAIGGDILGGLKAAHFNAKEFVIETYGDCTLDDWLIKPNIDLKKNSKLATTSYSRFQFKYENGSFTPATKMVIPLETNLNPASFRPKISFGENQ